MLLSHKARLSSPKLQQSSVSRSQIAPRRYQPSNVPRHVSFAASSDGQEEAAGGEGKDKGDKGKELGNVFQGDKRRRGRPAHLRSPYDTPLRDGNRDRLLGLLTER